MAFKTIVLKTGPAGMTRNEGITDEAVTPGHLMEQGGTNDVQKHSAQGQNAEKLFALENDLVGEDIDDAYASGDTVQMIAAQRGDELYVWLADGESATPGDALDSDGDGALRVHVPVDVDEAGTVTSTIIYVDAIVAYSLETVAPSGADGRIKVRVA